MATWTKRTAVESNPDRKGGAWVFTETRVPISALLENLNEDANGQEVVEWYLGVEISQVLEVFEHVIKFLSVKVNK